MATALRSDEKKASNLVVDDAKARSYRPQLEMVRFSAPTGIPNGWDAELLMKGVPNEMLGTFVAARELTLLDVPDLGPVVCFAHNSVHEWICLDPSTGAIVAVTYVPANTTNLEAGFYGNAGFVNSSLDQYIASVRTVIARFPFESSETERENLRTLDEAVEELRATLQAIDPAALADETTVWRTFLDDVQMGDYSTTVIAGDGK